MNDTSAPANNALANPAAAPAAPLPAPPRAVRPGWQTSEFWMTLLGHLGLFGGAVSGVLPPQYAALAAAASQVAYNLSRGLVKSGAAAAPVAS